MQNGFDALFTTAAQSPTGKSFELQVDYEYRHIPERDWTKRHTVLRLIAVWCSDIAKHRLYLTSTTSTELRAEVAPAVYAMRWEAALSRARNPTPNSPGWGRVERRRCSAWSRARSRSTGTAIRRTSAASWTTSSSSRRPGRVRGRVPDPVRGHRPDDARVRRQGRYADPLRPGARARGAGAFLSVSSWPCPPHFASPGLSRCSSL